MEFRVLDLFCGAGGFSCGLDSLKDFKTMIGVDFDKNVLETFKKNIKDSVAICGDLTDSLLKDEIVKKAKELKVNMIIGGPPCQGFSLKGKNLGLDDPRNFLFKEYLNLVEKIQPEVFVIENVKNLTNACEGYFLKAIITELKRMKYIVNNKILNASDYGVPQHRERTIIIGSKSRSISLPKPNNKKISVREAISDLSYLSSGEGQFESEYINKPESEYQKKMRKNSKVLYNHIATSHSKLALDKLSMIPPEGDKSSLPKELQGKQKFATTWSRLVWNEQSPTIDTRFDTPSNGRNSHPILNRAITPREAARLQSFPDSYVFYGKKCSVCKQIGNAVPPLLAREIGKAIMNTYEEQCFDLNDVKLYCCDSAIKVKELIAAGVLVDSIITDPPYNISKTNNFSTMTSSHRQGVDFGNWDKGFDVCGWISDYSKVLKKDGSIIVFCSYLYISFLAEEMAKNNIEVKDILVWKKTNPMPRNIERRYVQDMEFAIWGVKKGAKWVFNKPSDVPYLRSEFNTSTVSGNERTIHPTQKSLKLMKDIIEIHTNIGDVILDPFMGSGTTGVAAIQLKRKFIGMEISNDYYLIAKERFQEKLSQESKSQTKLASNY